MKVKVTNMVNSPVSVAYPELAFRREWPSKGASVFIESDMVEQLMYQIGFKNMIDAGVLYIEDMETKKELGLEPEDAKEPVNIIVLTDKERRQYMVSYPLEKFKTSVAKLSEAQVLELVDYAIKNKLMDYDKCEYLKEITGRDIITAVRLSAQNKGE